MSIKYDKQIIKKILYEAYKKEGRRLTRAELDKRKIVSDSTLSRHFKGESIDKIWSEIEEYYGLENYKEKLITEKKQKLIEDVQLAYKENGYKPLSSKKYKALEGRGITLFGSWTELIIASGIKQNRIIVDSLSDENLDDIIEKIIILSLNKKNPVTKTTIQKYKNMPSYEQVEKMVGMKWNELINHLDLTLSNENIVNNISDIVLLKEIDKKVKTLKNQTLLEYTKIIDEDYIPYTYVIDKLHISWNWFRVLSKNNFLNPNDFSFKCDKEDIIEILAFKYLMYGRQLRNIEIDNDRFLIKTTKLMTIFNCDIYELLLKAETKAKAFL